MIEVRQTAIFRDWLTSLRDKASAAIIMRRIDRVRAGLVGDVEPVGKGTRGCAWITVPGIGFTS